MDKGFRMVWINHRIFTRKWLERVERKRKSVDDGDRFISLWIAFNGWMKGKYGEDKNDWTLLDSVEQDEEFKRVFYDLSQNEPVFANHLNKLGEYSVDDMRGRDQAVRYDGQFESLIEVIYRIRCNLFHGRKNLEEDKRDFELVRLAYRILLPLFKKYLSTYEYR